MLGAVRGTRFRKKSPLFLLISSAGKYHSVGMHMIYKPLFECAFLRSGGDGEVLGQEPRHRASPSLCAVAALTHTCTALHLSTACDQHGLETEIHDSRAKIARCIALNTNSIVLSQNFEAIADVAYRRMQRDRKNQASLWDGTERAV